MSKLDAGMEYVKDVVGVNGDLYPLIEVAFVNEALNSTIDWGIKPGSADFYRQTKNGQWQALTEETLFEPLRVDRVEYVMLKKKVLAQRERIGLSIKKSEFLAGRGNSNDLYIGKGEISRDHISFYKAHSSRWKVKDLGSVHGTVLSWWAEEQGKLKKESEDRLNPNIEQYLIMRHCQLVLADLCILKWDGGSDKTDFRECLTKEGLTMYKKDEDAEKCKQDGKYIVWPAGQDERVILLTDAEYFFLRALMKAYPRFVSFEDLYEAIHGKKLATIDRQRETGNLYRIANRLEKTLQGVLGKEYQYLRSARGDGYLLEKHQAAEQA